MRRHLTYANVMATVAVFIALGGGAYAAVTISGRNITDRSMPGRKVRLNALGGSEVAERRLGKVPSAASADTATTAANAAQLDGKPPSDYRVSCPPELPLAAGGFCYRRVRIASNTWEGALRVCLRQGWRLPSPSELALIYDHSDAQQNAAWTDVAYAYSGGGTRALTVGQTVTRTLQFGDTPRNLAQTGYCITSPSDAP